MKGGKRQPREFTQMQQLAFGLIKKYGVVTPWDLKKVYSNQPDSIKSPLELPLLEASYQTLYTLATDGYILEIPGAPKNYRLAPGIEFTEQKP